MSNDTEMINKKMAKKKKKMMARKNQKYSTDSIAMASKMMGK